MHIIKYLAIIPLVALIACNQQTDNSSQLQTQIDSLQSQLNGTYKPGFGEFMSNIQAHHAKLWFAGVNENWKLAEFEVHEITESLEAIEKYQAGRKESQMVGMINPALDSVNIAIEKKSSEMFKNSYTLLTNTCNNCHRATEFEFNIVKIPDSSPFSNQNFRVPE